MATVYDLSADQLDQMHGTVDRFLVYLTEVEHRLKEKGFPADDALFHQVAATRERVRSLAAEVKYFAKCDRTAEPPKASRPMTVQEFLDSHKYVVASAVVIEGKTARSYRVAVAADTPCPFRPDMWGLLVANRRWVGGGRDEADLAGRMFDHGGAHLEADGDAWTAVRAKALT
jgi:hypothetical protein